MNLSKLLAQLNRSAVDKGIGQGQIKLLTALLRQRFGEVPAWAMARLREAAPAQLETWALRVLEAGSLEEVFEVAHDTLRLLNCKSNVRC